MNAQPSRFVTCSPRQGGFTLVEIVLALGIISFAIVALVGMLTVSMDSSRSSNEDTIAASIARQVVATLRTRTFDQLAASPPTTTKFDSEGRESVSDSMAAYKCVATVTPDPSYTANGKINLVQLRLEFSSNLSNKPASRVIQTAVARYE